MSAQTDEITHDLALISEDQEGRDLAFMATLRYRPADPWAVSLTLHLPGSDAAWLFARSLLARGLSRPVGRGVVQFEPAADDGGPARVAVRLGTDHGWLRATARATDLLTFVRDTWTLVPPGSESIDVDELTQLSR